MALTGRPLFIFFYTTLVARVKKINFVSSMQLTVVEFARRQKVHRGTVYRWIVSKTMPAGWKAKVFLTRLFITDED